jgi:hypothetical protein
MEGSCSTGQSPQRAVVPVEEEEEIDIKYNNTIYIIVIMHFVEKDRPYFTKIRLRIFQGKTQDIAGHSAGGVTDR